MEYNTFSVRGLCNPPYYGSDEKFMIDVGKIITEHTKGDVELITFYVVQNVHYFSEFPVEGITFSNGHFALIAGALQIPNFSKA